MIWGLLAIEALLFIEARRRIRIITAFDLIGCYLIACQLAFFSANSLPIVDITAPGQLRSHLYFQQEGQWLYFALFLICYSATLGLRVAVRADFNGLRREVQPLLQRCLPPVFGICATISLVQVLSTDAGALWNNARYLLLSKPEGLSWRNEVTQLAQEAAPLVGIVSAFALIVAIAAGRRVLTGGFLLVTAWCVAIGLANASRTAAVYLFVMTLAVLVLLPRRKWWAGGAASLTLLALLMALSGRTLRQYGLEMIPEFLLVAIATAPERLPFVVGNLTQGIFVTNDGFILQPQHSAQYKLLSFSPLPSFIDGFESFRRTQEVRLHNYVPMSAITEVISFGPVYMLAAGLSLVAGIRLALGAAMRGRPMLSLVSSIWLFLIFVQASAYPMRNVYRQGLLIIAVLLAISWLDRQRRLRQGAAGPSAITVTEFAA
jgi:hypothetical protein